MTVKEFVDKTYTDADFANKFSTAKSCDDVYEIAKEYGVTIEKNAFEEELKKCIKERSNLTENDVDGLVAAGSNVGISAVCNKIFQISIAC